MKIKTLYLIILIFSIFGCNKENKLTKIKLINSNLDIGNIKYGKIKDFNISIKNVGKNDLFIEKIQSSCKCVVISNKQMKILPNQTQNIKLQFHAIELGKSEESIVINSNTKEKFVFLFVTSNVIK